MSRSSLPATGRQGDTLREEPALARISDTPPDGGTFLSLESAAFLLDSNTVPETNWHIVEPAEVAQPRRSAWCVSPSSRPGYPKSSLISQARPSPRMWFLQRPAQAQLVVCEANKTSKVTRSLHSSYGGEAARQWLLVPRERRLKRHAADAAALRRRTWNDVGKAGLITAGFVAAFAVGVMTGPTIRDNWDQMNAPEEAVAVQPAEKSAPAPVKADRPAPRAKASSSRAVAR